MGEGGMSNQVIMCVDDEAIVLSSLKRELVEVAGSGYLIETAENGEDALELFAELVAETYEVPLIISDHIMPKMKGDALLTQIHGLSPTTLKIMLTGQADVRAITNAVNHAHLYRYIAKPWEPADLKLTVREALRSYAQAKQLAEQNKILQNMNLILEQQVRERTAELETQKIELAELNASKDKFFAIISHDLRSPLNALLGFTQTLAHHADTYPPAEVKTRAAKIHKSAESLYALLENLLTWARMQRGLIEYAPEVIDLWELAEDNLALFSTNAEHKEITLHSRVAEQTLTYADYSMVNTVIRNFISNALKFTPAHGRIELSATAGNGPSVEVAIADTGVGIPPDIAAALFRIDNRHTTNGTAGEKGTGLGLILCKELVEKNGGKVWVESALGQGTTFRFTLPAPPCPCNPK